MVDAGITGSHEVSGVNPIYNFIDLTTVGNTQSQNVIALPLVNQSPTNNFLFRFSGKGEEISFSFPIYHSDTDRSGGTAPAGTFISGVKTVAEQIDWLKNYVFNEDYDTYWTLVQSSYFSSNARGVITRLEFNQNAGEINYAQGKMTFKLGTIGNV